MADHSRRLLALGLRCMDVDFWKSAVYSPYPQRMTAILVVFADQIFLVLAV